jgi:hypothetical protein
MKKYSDYSANFIIKALSIPHCDEGKCNKSQISCKIKREDSDVPPLVLKIAKLNSIVSNTEW